MNRKVLKLYVKKTTFYDDMPSYYYQVSFWHNFEDESCVPIYGWHYF